MIITQGDFVSGDDPPGVPLIGWDSVVSGVTATSSASGCPVDNLLTPATHLFWRAGAATEQRLQITTTGPTDYLAIAKHNISQAGLAYTSNAEALAGTLESLVHFDGADASTQFVDVSGNDYGWIPSGDAQIDTAQSKFGGSSLRLDGTGDHLRTAGGIFAFGSGNFTIDFWIRLNATGTTQTLIDSRNHTEPAIGILLRITSGNVLQLYVNGSNRITGATALTTGTWYHVALTRSGTNTKLWLNGSQQGSTYTDSNVYVAGAVNNYLGTEYTSTNRFNGWVDEFRCLAGAAAWNAAFTPGTTAYSDGFTNLVGSYALLLHLDGTDGSTTITDDGGAGHVFTAVGGAQIDTAASQWGGASLLLNGTTAYLEGDGSDDFDFDADFTIEFWVRFSSVSGTQYLFDTRPQGAAINQYLALYKFTDNKLYLIDGTGTVKITGTSTFATGAFHHIALTRSGTDLKLWVNGVQEGSTASSISQEFLNAASRPRFGADTNAANFLNGWLDDIRIVKGRALFTSNFVIPWHAHDTSYGLGQVAAIEDDSPIIFRFDQIASGTTLVLTIPAMAEAAQMSVLYAGELLVLERGVKWDVQHQQLPHARRSSIVSGMSESGNFLGRVVLSEWREGKAEFAWFTPDWYRENFEPFVQSAITQPFFWAWNPDDYPEETSFAWLIEDIQPETDPVTRRVAATISMRAIA